MAAVVSLDGRITRGDDPNVHAWSSSEDWHHFLALRAEHDVVVIDRATFETVKPEPQAGLLRIVLTNHPDLYSDAVIKDQLEFMTISPKALIADLKKRGRERVLLAGGSTMSAEFLAADLVDDIYLTFEPLLFGAGRPVVDMPSALNLKLHLESIQQLNDQGTLLAHYSVAH
jgi:riboflavin biosynthesis pyrimidine reductase